MDRQPLACNLTALSAEDRAQRRSLIGQLRRALTNVAPVADGCDLQFVHDESVPAVLHHFIRFEQACCPFLTFRVLHRGGDILLRITGPEGTESFVRAEMIRPAHDCECS